MEISTENQMVCFFEAFDMGIVDKHWTPSQEPERLAIPPVPPAALAAGPGRFDMEKYHGNVMEIHLYK